MPKRSKQSDLWFAASRNGWHWTHAKHFRYDHIRGWIMSTPFTGDMLLGSNFLYSIMHLCDSSMKEIAKDSRGFWMAKSVEERKAAVEEFKARYGNDVY